MKRLHLVGVSKDGKRLVFAQKKGAKFGSFEAPLSPKLLRLVDEARQGRDARRREPAADELREAAPAEASVPPAEASVPPVGGPGEGEGSEQELARRDLGGPAPIGVVASIDVPVGPGAKGAEATEETVRGAAPQHQGHPSVGLDEPAREAAATVSRIDRIRPRTAKPEIPARSKLTPAEIQGLIRSGRGIRAVANLAGTPIDWVRYLAEPIQEERRGIVRQMLTRRQERARLGVSALPIGEALVENLRARGIRAPEEVIEEGFTASRPDGREWRVRLVFDHRGRRQVATWSFDAQSRQVTPLDSLATSLGWRRSSLADEDGAATTTRTRRASTGRAKTVKATARKRSGRASLRKPATRAKRRSR